MDISAIASAATSFKVAVDLAKGINSLKTSTEVREQTTALLDAVLEGRFKLLEASETQAALLARIKELEEKILGFENWDSEQQRYELKAIDTGAFAYVYKSGMENGEPPMWFCQTCFDKRHRSPLQFRAQMTRPNGGRGEHSIWGCNTCKSEVVVYYAIQPDMG